MMDANVRDEALTQSKMDLMFVKENRHKQNMDFDTFLNLLSKISEVKYPDLMVQ